MSERLTSMSTFSISEYCISNLDRKFDGRSFAQLILPKEEPVREKKANDRVFRDGEGNITPRKKLQELLGISKSNLVYVYEKYGFDHTKIFGEYLEKKRNVNVFKLPDGTITDAPTLAALFGCSTSSVSQKYTDCNNDYIKANDKLMGVARRKGRLKGK